jgi:serine/threonine protein kinase
MTPPILGKYHALERLGAGAYGNFYLFRRFYDRISVVLGLVLQAMDARDDCSALYAIKLERASKKRRRTPSEHEANVLKYLFDAGATSPRIPRVIDYGYDKPRRSKALVLDLLGPDLQSLRKKCGGQFSIRTTLILAIQLVCIPPSAQFASNIAFSQIPTIRYIHSKDFVHRDIKPSNILLGPKGSETNVYIVDFGIARRYRNPRNGFHMPFLDEKSVVGTVRYMSLNTHLGIGTSLNTFASTS